MGMSTMLPLVRREEMGGGVGPEVAPLPQSGAAGAILRIGEKEARRRGLKAKSSRRRGNPNWTLSKMRMPSDECEHPTRFELMLSDFGLEEENCLQDFRARHWIRKHAKLYYVPEYLLKALGEEVEITDL